MSSIINQIVSIPAPFNMVVLIVLIASAAGVVSTIAKQIRKYASHRQELDFKRELVDRGMSADEIERVVAARSEAIDAPSSGGCRTPRRPSVARNS